MYSLSISIVLFTRTSEAIRYLSVCLLNNEYVVLRKLTEPILNVTSGFGSVDVTELNMMATVPDHTHVFVVDDVHTLDTVRDELYLEICNLIGQS